MPSDIETLTALAEDLGRALSDIAAMVPKPATVAVLERRYGADKLHPYVKSTQHRDAKGVQIMTSPLSPRGSLFIDFETASTSTLAKHGVKKVCRVAFF